MYEDRLINKSSYNRVWTFQWMGWEEIRPNPMICKFGLAVEDWSWPPGGAASLGQPKLGMAAAFNVVEIEGAAVLDDDASHQYFPLPRLLNSSSAMPLYAFLQSDDLSSPSPFSFLFPFLFVLFFCFSTTWLWRRLSFKTPLSLSLSIF